MTNLTIVKYTVILTVSFLIAFFLGNKRNIGFAYSFIISIFLSPIIGLIVTILSSKYQTDEIKINKNYKITGIMLIILGILIFITFFGYYHYMGDNYNINSKDGFLLWMSIGCGVFTIGLYLYNRGKGETYASKNINNFSQKNEKSIKSFQVNEKSINQLDYDNQNISINEIMDNYQNIKSQKIITKQQVVISAIIGIAISILLNSGSTFGKLGYYV